MFPCSETTYLSLVCKGTLISHADISIFVTIISLVQIMYKLLQKRCREIFTYRLQRSQISNPGNHHNPNIQRPLLHTRTQHMMKQGAYPASCYYVPNPRTSFEHLNETKLVYINSFIIKSPKRGTWIILICINDAT